MQRLPLILLLVLLTGVFPARADTVLTLPFFNRSPSANLDWIGESVAETLCEALASEGVLALDREDRLEAFRRLSLRPGAVLTHASIIKVGEALDAGKVIYGEYELIPAPPAGPGAPASRGSLRLSARIIDLKRLQQAPEFSQIGARTATLL